MSNNKFLKQRKHKIKTYSFNDLGNGFYGLRVLESCRLTPKQLESIRRVFVRLTRREGKFWLRVFVNTTLTKKSKGSRMGKGLGNFDSKVINVKAGQIIIEFSYLNPTMLASFLAGIKGKIPAKIELVMRQNIFLEEEDEN